MAGVRFNRNPDFLNSYVPPVGSPTKEFGNPNTFTAAADQQAKDYDKIMGMYGNLYNKANNDPLSFSPISAQTSNYSASPDVTRSMSNLSELSRTGGYTDQGIQDLRERGISPIRSIYASAQRNIDRQKSLSGGYSPNYGALTAKMAREMADKIGGITTDVNAGIAQNVASNKLQAAPQYSGAAQRENEARTASEKGNADIINQINQFNAQMQMNAQKSNRGEAFDAASGMRSLYGTTPALTNLFGNQVMQAKGSNQQQQQIDEQRSRDRLNFVGGRRAG